VPYDGAVTEIVDRSLEPRAEAPATSPRLLDTLATATVLPTFAGGSTVLGHVG
jgi:hypothetical protein